MNRLLEAIRLSWSTHKDQVDKAGQPFLGHPLRVMAEMETEDDMIVAVLHDVFEEQLKRPSGGVTPAGYAMHRADGQPNLLTETQAKALDALTRIPKEPYFTYIARVRRNPLARKVKLADLRDNLDPRRANPEANSLRDRYRQAIEMLTWVLDD